MANFIKVTTKKHGIMNVEIKNGVLFPYNNDEDYFSDAYNVGDISEVRERMIERYVNVPSRWQDIILHAPKWELISLEFITIDGTFH